MNHKKRINRLLDSVTNRALFTRCPMSARLVSVSEIADALTKPETCQLIRSAYALAREKPG